MLLLSQMTKPLAKKTWNNKKMTKMERRKFRILAKQSKGVHIASITSESWLAAFVMIKNGEKIAVVARGMGVKRSTLSMRYNAQNSSVTVIGKPVVLPLPIEKKLAKHIIYCADAGLPITKSNVQIFARTFAKEANIPATTFNGGDDWYYAFLDRNPEIANRAAKKLNGARASGFNRALIIKWFATTKGIFEQYTPLEVYNLDDKHINSEEMIPKKVSASRECATLGNGVSHTIGAHASPRIAASTLCSSPHFKLYPILFPPSGSRTFRW